MIPGVEYPLADTVWPLYVELCSVNGVGANRANFYEWLELRTKVMLMGRAQTIAQIREKVLQSVQSEIDMQRRIGRPK